MTRCMWVNKQLSFPVDISAIPGKRTGREASRYEIAHRGSVRSRGHFWVVRGPRERNNFPARSRLKPTFCFKGWKPQYTPLKNTVWGYFCQFALSPHIQSSPLVFASLFSRIRFPLSHVCFVFCASSFSCVSATIFCVSSLPASLSSLQVSW